MGLTPAGIGREPRADHADNGDAEERQHVLDVARGEPANRDDYQDRRSDQQDHRQAGEAESGLRHLRNLAAASN